MSSYHKDRNYNHKSIHDSLMYDVSHLVERIAQVSMKLQRFSVSELIVLVLQPAASLFPSLALISFTAAAVFSEKALINPNYSTCSTPNSH